MKKWLFLIVILAGVSCSPQINYLGESYKPSTEVDIYYDEGDIRRDFKVMGLMSSDNVDNPFATIEKIKEKMIIKAKENGADAIWFINLVGLPSGDVNSEVVIECKLLKYR